MGENKGDASGPADGGDQNWLEGRHGLSRESLARAEEEVDGTESDAGVVDRVRTVVSAPVALAARIREVLAGSPDDVTDEAGDETFSTEADGGPALADRTHDEQEVGTTPSTGGTGSRQDGDRAGTGDESEFNWGGADGDAERTE